MAGKLNALRIKGLKKPGRYADGGGLYIQVRDGGRRRSWIFRYMLAGRARAIGLGSLEDVGLAEARDLASKARRLVKSGIDPLERRPVVAQTFENVTDLYLTSHSAGWRSAKVEPEWRNSLQRYVYPVLGSMPVTAVDTGAVMRALDPIWRSMPDTATRVRGRIEAVLDYAKARGWREGENPARWRGHLANLLPAKRRVARVKHHAALPWSEIGELMKVLATRGQSIPALALRFTILTAARSGEVLGMRWHEVDLEARVWIVPGERMKAGREHRVPLSDAALSVLAIVPLRHEFIFFGRDGQKSHHSALLDMLKSVGRDDLTVHGFRSTFRDWATEQTAFPREVCEAALAHTIGTAVERAYARSDLFEKRRLLMQEWGVFCTS